MVSYLWHRIATRHVFHEKQRTLIQYIVQCAWSILEPSFGGVRVAHLFFSFVWVKFDLILCVIFLVILSCFHGLVIVLELGFVHRFIILVVLCSYFEINTLVRKESLPEKVLIQNGALLIDFSKKRFMPNLDPETAFVYPNVVYEVYMCYSED